MYSYRVVVLLACAWIRRAHHAWYIAVVLLACASPLWSANTAQVYLAAHDGAVEILQANALIGKFAKVATAQDASLLVAGIEAARKSASDKKLKAVLFDLEGQARTLNGFLNTAIRTKGQIDLLYLLGALNMVNDSLKKDINSYLKLIVDKGGTIEKHLVMAMQNPQARENPQFWIDFGNLLVKHIYTTYGDVALQKNWSPSDLARYWHYLTFVWEACPDIDKPNGIAAKLFRWVSGRLTLLGLIKGTNYSAEIAPGELFDTLAGQLTKTGTLDGFKKQLAMLKAIPAAKVKPEIEGFITQVAALVKVMEGDKSVTKKDIAGIVPYVTLGDALTAVNSLRA